MGFNFNWNEFLLVSAFDSAARGLQLRVSFQVVSSS